MNNFFKVLEQIKIIDNGEKLVEIINKDIILEPIYFKKKFKGSIEKMYLRERVIKILNSISNELIKHNLNIIVFDAYRTIELQTFLAEQNTIALEEGFISPLNNLDKFTPPHMTGGAIDLAICKDKKLLNFGTKFDDFTSKANTMYYKGINSEIHSNRMMLVEIMQKYGFTNYSMEWWHFDYGNQFWASVKNTDAFYGNIQY